jgi:hypothetical protein
VHVEYRLKGSQLVPVRFGLSGIEHEVAEVLDCWPGEGHLYVKVRTTKDDLYILRYDETRNAWEVRVFREGEPSVPEGSATVDSTVD